MIKHLDQKLGLGQNRWTVVLAWKYDEVVGEWTMKCTGRDIESDKIKELTRPWPLPSFHSLKWPRLWRFEKRNVAITANSTRTVWIAKWAEALRFHRRPLTLATLESLERRPIEIPAKYWAQTSTRKDRTPDERREKWKWPLSSARARPSYSQLECDNAFWSFYIAVQISSHWKTRVGQTDT